MTTMRQSKFLILFVLLLLFGVLFCFLSDNGNSQQNFWEKPSVVPLQGPEVFQPGETIKYDIKTLGVKAGEATLKFKGLQKFAGKDAYLVVFVATSANFFDEEKIYADPEGFYPLAVIRDLNIWGKKEKITELYNREKGIIKITKLSHNKTTEEVIKKEGPIDNIYCFIYRYRKTGQFNMGDALSIHLPTKDVMINLVKMATLSAAGNKYEAYFMQSDPAKYKVWFDTSIHKIPLRINGAVGINDTALVMTEYQPAENNKSNDKEAQ